MSSALSGWYVVLSWGRKRTHYFDNAESACGKFFDAQEALNTRVENGVPWCEDCAAAKGGRPPVAGLRVAEARRLRTM